LPGGHVGIGAIRQLALVSDLHLELLLIPAASHDQLEGVADELGIGHAGAEGTTQVVQHHFVRELTVEFPVHTTRVLDQAFVCRDDDHLEGREVDGPDEALLVVVLLHDGLHDSGDPDTVAAHPERDRLVVLVREHGVHGFGVDLLELEDVPQLDALAQLERALAARAALAIHDLREVVVLFGLGEVPTGVDVHVVDVRLVAAAEEVPQPLDRLVEEVRHRLPVEDALAVEEVDRTGEADGSTSDLFHDGGVCGLDALSAEQVRELDLRDLEIATHGDDDRLVPIRDEHDGLDHLVRTEVDELLELDDGTDVRRVDVLKGGQGHLLVGEHRRGLLLVRTVVAQRTV